MSFIAKRAPHLQHAARYRVSSRSKTLLLCVRCGGAHHTLQCSDERAAQQQQRALNRQQQFKQSLEETAPPGVPTRSPYNNHLFPRFSQQLQTVHSSPAAYLAARAAAAASGQKVKISRFILSPQNPHHVLSQPFQPPERVQDGTNNVTAVPWRLDRLLNGRLPVSISRGGYENSPNFLVIRGVRGDTQSVVSELSLHFGPYYHVRVNPSSSTLTVHRASTKAALIDAQFLEHFKQWLISIGM